MLKIGVLISGGGTNLQALIDNINEGNIDGKIELIVSNKKRCLWVNKGKISWHRNPIFRPKSICHIRGV